MKRFTIMLLVSFAFASCGGGKHAYDVIPFPNSLTPRGGEFSLSGAGFTCDALMDSVSRAAVGALAERLVQTSDCGSVAYAEDAESKSGFRFVVDSSLGKEQYKLDITRREVTVRASALPGFLYAVQTIKQLLPAEVFGTGDVDGQRWTLPCVAIDDVPRFAYRGQHLDVARHFFDVDQVKKIIDVMVLHKLNTLHWHLTDDQGWRIEIKRYPELTTYGSIRKKTMIRKEFDNYDTTPYGGFYTQDQIREVVRYAAERAITVIPEVDLPGHMLAALACYPELGCTGGPYEVWGQWGVFEEVLCPGKEKTFEFIEGVLTEVMELFPAEYIHIGGDECPKTCWEKCPRCQTRIREQGIKGDEKHAAEFYLQSYVTERVEKFLNARGRRIIGWDEILEGKLAPNATVMSWRGTQGGMEAARRGHDAIMTPTSYMYLDYYQSLDTQNEPFGIGGYVPIERVYSYEPLADSLPQELQKHILGVQANLWTEYIHTDAHLEYMLLPRMAALSEVQWCYPERKEWLRLLASLPHIAAIYNVMGYNYAKTVFGVLNAVKVNPDKGCVEVTLSTLDNAPIRYTLDGTQPTVESPLYTAPVEVRGACTLKARVMREGVDTPVWSRNFAGGKAMGRKVKAATASTPAYTFGGAQMLTDGVQGNNSSFGDGSWVGWLHEPLDVTIDMDGQSYSSIRLGALVQRLDWLFAPQKITVSTSDDNFTFTEVAVLDIPGDGQNAPNEVRRYTLSFPQTQARYLRVVAQPLQSIPDWHQGKGGLGHLFTDEIFVE